MGTTKRDRIRSNDANRPTQNTKVKQVIYTAYQLQMEAAYSRNRVL